MAGFHFTGYGVYQELTHDIDCQLHLNIKPVRKSVPCNGGDYSCFRIDPANSIIYKLGDEDVALWIHNQPGRICEFRRGCRATISAKTSLTGSRNNRLFFRVGTHLGDNILRTLNEVDVALGIDCWIGRRGLPRDVSWLRGAVLIGPASLSNRVHDPGFEIDATNATVFGVGYENIACAVEGEGFGKEETGVNCRASIAAETAFSVACNLGNNSVRGVYLENLVLAVIGDKQISGGIHPQSTNLPEACGPSREALCVA